MSIISFSGPHGSGKTTLINKMLFSKKFNAFIDNEFEIDFLAKFPSFSKLSNFERSLIRLYHRYYIYQSNLMLEKQDEHKITLISRGIYDSIAYIETYHRLGIMLQHEYDILHNIYSNIKDMPRTVILNPPVEVIMKRLEKRRSEKVRVKRDHIFSHEDAIEFVTMMHDIFEKFQDDVNVFYITDNEDDDIEQIVAWINDGDSHG